MYPEALLCHSSQRVETTGKCRSRTGRPSIADRIGPINAETIYEELVERGLIAARDNYRIEAAGVGLNTRVYVARRPDHDPALTIRVRRPHDRSTAEIDALSDVSGCPGAPRLHLLTHNLLVLDFLPGEPRDLALLSERQLEVLARQLACIHEIEYAAYTPWPEQELHEGTRADLFRFRVASLANYDCYAAARNGDAHAALPGLIERLAEPKLSSPSWKSVEFSRLHGDLSRGNLLWSGDELGLIDWEFSRIGDPAEDLAYLLTEQSSGIGRLPRLISLYGDAGGAPDTPARIPDYGLFTAVDSMLWWIDYARAHTLDVRAELEQRLAAANHWVTLSESP